MLVFSLYHLLAFQGYYLLECVESAYVFKVAAFCSILPTNGKPLLKNQRREISNR